jgi:hypothetical protein
MAPATPVVAATPLPPWLRLPRRPHRQRRRLPGRCRRGRATAVPVTPPTTPAPLPANAK